MSIGITWENLLKYRFCVFKSGFQQFKIDSYMHRVTCVNLMVTTKQKLTINKQKKVRKESKHNTKKIIKPQEKKRRN